MEERGVIVKKLTEREGVSQRSGQPWKTAEFLIEIPGRFPRHMTVQVSNGLSGRIARFESLVGKDVTVSFDIDAHEWEGRWFNEIKAWGVMEAVPAQAQEPTTSPISNGEPLPFER